MISERGITRDREEMKRVGIGGAMIFDAGMPAGPTPVAPRFMGTQWRQMFQHAVAEADRLGMEICRFQVADGQPLTMTFDETTSQCFRLLITAAYDAGSSRPSRNVQIREFSLLEQKEQYVERFPIKNWRVKSGYQNISSGLLPGTLQEQASSVPDEVDLESGQLVDLSEKTDRAGHLRWKVPPGRWCVLRIGHTLTGTEVICSSPGGEGHMLDFIHRTSNTALPLEKRFTATNVEKFKPDSTLVASGLLGPVTVQATARGAKYE